ncbi:alpha/beta fold hydrolase [Lentzea terrae]|uniref:alpha/beta fold hydrolase n=1 Tax=Lentzea terrae TaxID=2200761 RepID=UPI001E631A2A|nr:alpha/beta fold hydrolase [Lentzea terrae]
MASAEDILAALEEFVDEHTDAPFLLIGESFGGRLARALTHRRPSQVRGLALLCPVAAYLGAPGRRCPRSRFAGRTA